MNGNDERLSMVRCPACNGRLDRDVFWERFTYASGLQGAYPICGDCFDNAAFAGGDEPDPDTCDNYAIEAAKWHDAGQLALFRLFQRCERVALEWCAMDLALRRARVSGS